MAIYANVMVLAKGGTIKIHRSRLAHNTKWNLLGAGVPLLLGVITVPYLNGQLGEEALGILTLIWPLIGYFSLFEFGLGRGLTQQIATKRATGLVDQVPSLVKTGLLLTTAAGLIGGGILACLANVLGYKWLNISTGSLQQSTAHALLIVSLGIPLTTLTVGLRGVLEGYEDFKTANLLRMLLGFATLGLPALSVMVFGPSLVLVVTSLIVARLISLAAHVYLVNKKLVAKQQKPKFSWANTRSLLIFGTWMTVSNIISPLMVNADRFIISAVLGASLVVYYTVPFDTLFRLLIIPGALTVALFPTLTSIIVTDREASRRLYRKCLKVITVFMTVVCLSVAAGSYWLMKLWMGQDFAINSWHVASIIAVGVIFNGIAQVPLAAIHATGNARVTAIVHVCEFCFYVPVLLILLIYMGLPGVAITWAARAGADCLILLIFAHKCMLKANK